MQFCLLYQIIYIKHILNLNVLKIRNNFQEIIIKVSRLKLKCMVHFIKDSTIIQGKQLIDLAVYDKPGFLRFFVLYIFLSTSLNLRLNLAFYTSELTPL